MSTVIVREDKPIFSNAVFGMILFVFTEIMFFMALISAFLVIQKDRGSTWDLPSSIQLPIFVTAVNTGVLFLSGAALYWAGRELKLGRSASSAKWVLRSGILAVLFVGIQGSEWIELIGHGMTMTTTIFGACFFLLVGSHAAHAVAGIIALMFGYTKARQDKMTIEGLQALQIFWFFIVGVWPILYFVVYF